EMRCRRNAEPDTHPASAGGVGLARYKRERLVQLYIGQKNVFDEFIAGTGNRVVAEDGHGCGGGPGTKIARTLRGVSAKWSTTSDWYPIFHSRRRRTAPTARSRSAATRAVRSGTAPSWTATPTTPTGTPSRAPWP